MADHLDFIVHSTEKVLRHCEALLNKPLSSPERARLNARVEAEREFLTRLMASQERHAA
jgi:hypothetical protein